MSTTYEPQTCTFCEGTGMSDYATETAPTVECPMCSGTGKITVG